MKLFLTAFIVVLSTGYGIGLAFVEHTTSLSTPGVEQQFLGSIDPERMEEMRYPKSVNEMYVFIHNHVLALSLIFFCVGAIFYFSSTVPESVKRFLLIEPMAAIVTTFGGIALVRFVSPHFSWLVVISGGSLLVCYAAIVYLVMKELWFIGQRQGADATFT